MWHHFATYKWNFQQYCEQCLLAGKLFLRGSVALLHKDKHHPSKCLNTNIMPCAEPFA